MTCIVSLDSMGDHRSIFNDRAVQLSFGVPGRGNRNSKEGLHKRTGKVEGERVGWASELLTKREMNIVRLTMVG